MDWSDEIREILEPMKEQGKVLNIFPTLARHPRIFRRWMPFGGQLLFKSSLPAREREMLILRVSWLTRAEYEWAQHVQIAKEAGLTDTEIARIKEGPSAQGWAIFDGVILRAVDELHKDYFISDGTWQILARRYDEKQLLELLFIVGHYSLLAMVLNSVGVQLEEGTKGFDSQT
jgi:AhpD family alkylhydroperoxidase